MWRIGQNFYWMKSSFALKLHLRWLDWTSEPSVCTWSFGPQSRLHNHFQLPRILDDLLCKLCRGNGDLFCTLLLTGEGVVAIWTQNPSPLKLHRIEINSYFYYSIKITISFSVMLRVFINSEVTKIEQKTVWDWNFPKRDKDRPDIEDKETR